MCQQAPSTRRHRVAIPARVQTRGLGRDRGQSRQAPGPRRRDSRSVSGRVSAATQHVASQGQWYAHARSTHSRVFVVRAIRSPALAEPIKRRLRPLCLQPSRRPIAPQNAAMLRHREPRVTIVHSTRSRPSLVLSRRRSAACNTSPRFSSRKCKQLTRSESYCHTLSLTYSE
jgi:hypothetical protein